MNARKLPGGDAELLRRNWVSDQQDALPPRKPPAATCGAETWDALHEISHTCTSRRGHGGTHMEIDPAGIVPTYGWGFRPETVRVRVTWSETVTLDGTRELDAAAMRRLGYNPADPSSIQKYLDDAYEFTGDDFMQWHSDFSDVARRIDADAATIESVEIEPL